MAEADRGAPGQSLSGYIPGFDGLRAMAVGIVLVAHAGYERIIPGGLGVTVFFAISGFLITNLLLGEYARHRTIDLKLFYIRRFLRLYPELLACVGLTLLAGAWFGWAATIWEKLGTVFYYYNYYYIYGKQQLLVDSYPWRHLWSLAVEEHFYFLFPALMLMVAAQRGKLLWAIWLLLLLPLIWRSYLWFAFDLPWNHNYVATDARIDSIAWGSLLAVMLRARLEDGKTMLGGWYIHPAWMVVGIGLLLVTLLVRDPDFRWTIRFTVQGVALFLILGNLLFDPRWGLAVKALEWEPIRYAGRISYGLYLYHMLVYRLVDMALPDSPKWLFAPVAITAAFAVAALSYRVIDDPMKVLRRRFGSHVGYRDVKAEA